MGPISSWTETTGRTWKTPEHNNVSEARASVAAMDVASREAMILGKRLLMMTDSQVTLGVLAKRRSPIKVLNRLARRAAATTLGLSLKATGGMFGLIAIMQMRQAVGEILEPRPGRRREEGKEGH